MASRYCYYEIHLPLDEVWNSTLHFWETNKGNIEHYETSPNGLYRGLVIKRSMSFTSSGERYNMMFGYDYNANLTVVSIDVQLAFGGGAQWNKPKKVIRNWARGLRLKPAPFVKKTLFGIRSVVIFYLD